MKIVPDTSVVIDGRITQIVQRKKPGEAEVIIPEAVVAELEAQADRGQETGYKGLDELKALALLASQGKIKLRYVGRRPTLEEIQLAGGGEIDAMIREVAQSEGAVFITSDSVQSRVAEAKGIPTEYMKSKPGDRPTRVSLLDYFRPDVMSVHLKANVVPRVKAGVPGKMKLQEVGEQPLTDRDLKEMTKEIIEAAKGSRESFIEMDEGGATVVQFENIRIVIARPPFADGWEITAVKPVTKMELSKYKFAEVIEERLRDRYRGILVAGPPGAGKSTLAQAMADYLESVGWIVKTMEKPRDLQVSDRVTQYTALEGDMAKTADLLLLVRPDYTIFDEVRKTPDFQVFADLRLAGVGMIGVVHATRGIDAIQRLIGRVELGMIPQIIDTVLFVEDGAIKTLYDLRYTVKVPVGMIEQDLARPVIEVVDHETAKVDYELYTYGEEVVVMPVAAVSMGASKPLWTLAERQIAFHLGKLVDGPIQVTVDGENKATVYVKEGEIGALLGRGGSRIQEIEEELGVHIDVRPLEDLRRGRASTKVGPATPSAERRAEVGVDRKVVTLDAGPDLGGRNVEVTLDGSVIFQGTVSRDGVLKFSKGSEQGRKLQEAYFAKKEVHVRPFD